MNRIVQVLAAAVCIALSLGACSDRDADRSHSAEGDRKMNAFIDSLMGQMTLEEKIGQ